MLPCLSRKLNAAHTTAQHISHNLLQITKTMARNRNNNENPPVEPAAPPVAAPPPAPAPALAPAAAAAPPPVIVQIWMETKVDNEPSNWKSTNELTAVEDNKLFQKRVVV
jgi:hypothetical protein